MSSSRQDKPLAHPLLHPAQRNSVTRRLTFFYIASLGTIAGLSMLGHFLIQKSLTQQELDIQVISAAQQQQMLIPQLSKTARMLRLSSDSSERQQLTTELEELIKTVETQQKTLTTLAVDSRLSGRQYRMQQMMSQLMPAQQTILTLVREEMTTNPAASLRSRPGFPPPGSQFRRGAPPSPEMDGDPLKSSERTFMRDMDQLILTYNQQVAASVKQLKTLEMGLLIFTLLVLVLEGVVVFRPAVQQIHQALSALEKSLQHLAREQQKAEKLLLNILPQPIAHRLKHKQQAIADGFGDVTVLFADIVGFTQLSTMMPPEKLVTLLNQIFSTFDHLTEKHGLEKIKTIGDAYMVVGGLPIPRADHAEAIVAMALDMQRAIEQFNREIDESLSIRIGINSGPVVAGVIGIRKFIYDLWGDTVNIASRMESHGFPGSIQITESTYQLIKHKYSAQSRGKIAIKGKGEMETYLVTGSLESLAQAQLLKMP